MCSEAKRRKVPQSRDSSPTIWQAGAYDEGGFVVKWTQMEVEEYNMAHFKIQCMLFNTVESRLSEKRWVLEFVVDSISGDDITLHADFYSGSGG